jgi:hypothetical protein
MNTPRDDINDDNVRSGVSRRFAMHALTATSLASLLAVRGSNAAIARESTPQATPSGAAPPSPRLEWLGTLSGQLGELITVGATPHGTRLIAPVTGGTFMGPRLDGTILASGGDWMIVRADDVGEIDVRIAIQTHDDATIYMTYRGYLTNVLQLLPRWAQGEEISPDDYYLATTPYFETSAPQYDWLQRTVAVGVGALTRGGIQYEVFTVNA